MVLVVQWCDYDYYQKGNSGKVKVNLKANWGVSSRAIPRYETMDEAGYLETIFQSYKNNQIINGGVSPELAGVAALEAMKVDPLLC